MSINVSEPVSESVQLYGNSQSWNELSVACLSIELGRAAAERTLCCWPL